MYTVVVCWTTSQQVKWLILHSAHGSYQKSISSAQVVPGPVYMLPYSATSWPKTSFISIALARKPTSHCVQAANVLCHFACFRGIITYAMTIGKLPFFTPFKDEYQRQRMLQQIQKGLSSYHDREMQLLSPGTYAKTRKVWRFFSNYIVCFLVSFPSLNIAIAHISFSPQILSRFDRNLICHENNPRMPQQAFPVPVCKWGSGCSMLSFA